jgi:trigger factor
MEGYAALKLEKTQREDHQVLISAEFDTETLNKYKARGARSIAQQAKIPGFRPGKAPLDVIRRFFGDEAIEQKAIELLVDDMYPQVLTESGVEPSGPGKLEKIVSMDPPVFEFVIPLAPEVNLGDYQSIRQDYNLEPVSEDEINETVERIRRSSAKAEPVDRPAAEGDQVSAVISATIIAPEEGQSDSFIRQNSFNFTIGDKDDTWPYAGFADQFIGMSKCEEKIFIHQYPEDASIQRVQGKEVEFKVLVDAVNEMRLPELNDEFAKSIGDFDSYEKLLNVIRTQLAEDKQKNYNQEYFSSLIEKLVAQSTIKYPPSLVEDEIEDMLENINQDLSRQKMDLDTYLKLRESTKEKFIEEEVRPSAIKRLERSLAVEEFSQREGIKVSEEEIQSLYTMSLERIKNSPDRKMGKKNETEQLARSFAVSTAYQMLNQRINDRLKDIATQVEGSENPAESITEESSTPSVAENSETDNEAKSDSPEQKQE